MKTTLSSRSRGFTLIELMVVISIIALLSSIILANTQNARASARDATRVEEVHQIDNAVQTYGLSVGHAPDLGGTCTASTGGSLTSTTVLNCTPLSTAPAGSAQQLAWQKLVTDLQPYMPGITTLTDPCNGGCSSNSGLTVGYTYVAPAALIYNCTQSNTCGQLTTDASSQYQLYAPLENTNIYVAPGGSGGTVYAPGGPVPSISISSVWLNSPSTTKLFRTTFTVTGLVPGIASCNFHDANNNYNYTVTPPGSTYSYASIYSIPPAGNDYNLGSCTQYGVTGSKQTSVQ